MTEPDDEVGASADGAAPESRRDRRRSNTRLSRRMAFLRDIAVIVIIALSISFVVRTFLVRSFYVPSGSMEHTLEVNDRIIVNELYPQFISLERGDVIVFTDPGGWLGTADTETQPQNPIAWTAEWLLTFVGLGAADSNDHLVKRLIGLPGDHVVCCDIEGKLQINGVSITEPYLPAGVAPSDMEFDVTVPADSLWVMGDNRDHSGDSRANINQPGGGFVPESKVVGKAFVISWPISRWTSLSNYPEVFDSVPEPQTTTGGQ